MNTWILAAIILLNVLTIACTALSIVFSCLAEKRRQANIWVEQDPGSIGADS